MLKHVIFAPQIFVNDIPDFKHYKQCYRRDYL